MSSPVPVHELYLNSTSNLLPSLPTYAAFHQQNLALMQQLCMGQYNHFNLAALQQLGFYNRCLYPDNDDPLHLEPCPLPGVDPFPWHSPPGTRSPSHRQACFPSRDLKERVELSRAADSEDGSAGLETNALSTSRCLLPAWCLHRGQVVITMHELFDKNLLEQFATDKVGCHFLQEQFASCDGRVRSLLYGSVFGKEELFFRLSHDVFGNFIVQKLIEDAIDDELNLIEARLEKPGIVLELALHRYSCRVVQKAIEVLPRHRKGLIILALQGHELELSTDQNANHVIQRVLSSCPPSGIAYSMLIDAFVASENCLFAVVENKYGCRVIQVALEELCRHISHPGDSDACKKLLDKLTTPLVLHCDRLTRNEFANYIMQYVIKTKELHKAAERVMNNCILNNILTLSQEKCASHVVEKAMKHASARFFHAMVEEIFEGYIPDEDGRTALDIMLFDQYGNYVVQTLVDELARKRDTLPAMRIWWESLVARIAMHRVRLMRYSSGKKIIEQVRVIQQSQGNRERGACDVNANDVM